VVRHSQATEQAENDMNILVQENETKIEVIEKKRLDKQNKYNSSRWSMEKQQQQNQTRPRRKKKKNGNVLIYRNKFNC